MSSSNNGFSLEEYCSLLEPSSLDHLHESSVTFLKALNLPTVHPFCVNDEPLEFPSPSVPPMGPMVVENHHSNMLDVLVTLSCQAAPALLAMGELWLRLFASALGPLCICHLMWMEVSSLSHSTRRDPKKPNKKKSNTTVVVALSCLLSVASSVVLMTDTYYVLQHGAQYGASLLCLATLLSFRACFKYGLKRIKRALMVLLLIALYLVSFPFAQFGGPHVPDTIDEGLYFSSNNHVARQIAQHWPIQSRTYSVENGATPWMPTGDSRTGLPFLLNFWHDPEWTRVYLTTFDEEVVALDVCFPPTGGHDVNKAVYLILHGLNGGSEEEYIKDLVHRRSAEGHTMIVMVARGLMDLPVKGWNVFHGARVDDAHTAATALRRSLPPKQLLVGVGYSMGAIVLSNYVARSGTDCPLDAALAVSGGLDMRFELDFDRAKRLWQPLLVTDLRHKFILGKFGERYRHKLTQQQMLELMRAYHVSDVDEHAVVTYHGFDNITHYYSEMSALGDIPMEQYNKSLLKDDNFRISNVSVPFCVLHALDDPLITWRSVASKQQDELLHPTNLVETGSGNLMLLLTKSGGHVGWPTGWLPHLQKWKWMSDAVKGYVDAVVQAKKSSLT